MNIFVIRRINTLKNIFRMEQTIMGRWNPMLDEKKKEERALRSSSDHCGDYICGNPEKVKEIINLKKK